MLKSKKENTKGDKKGADEESVNTNVKDATSFSQFNKINMHLA